METLTATIEGGVVAAALLSAWYWWLASRQRVRRIARDEILDAADMNRLVTSLNRTQLLNARAALATAAAGVLAAVRMGIDLAARF
jgi:hypothetical protein